MLYTLYDAGSPTKKAIKKLFDRLMNIYAHYFIIQTGLIDLQMPMVRIKVTELLPRSSQMCLYFTVNELKNPENGIVLHAHRAMVLMLHTVSNTILEATSTMGVY